MTNPRITSTIVVMGSSATSRWPRRDPISSWLVDARGRYRNCGTFTLADAQSTGRFGLTVVLGSADRPNPLPAAGGACMVLGSAYRPNPPSPPAGGVCAVL